MPSGYTHIQNMVSVLGEHNLDEEQTHRKYILCSCTWAPRKLGKTIPDVAWG